MQITIQKKYLILVEVSENIFRLFLIVVNYVFNIFEETREVFVSSVNEIKQEVKDGLSNFYKDTKEKVGIVFNFIRALFGFNIYKLELIQIKTKTNEIKNIFKNNDFLIYSNLLAPPKNYF